MSLRYEKASAWVVGTQRTQTWKTGLSEDRCVGCKGQLHFGRFFYHWAPDIHACSRSCLRRWLRRRRSKESN